MLQTHPQRKPTKKRIRQSNSLNPLHIQIIQQIRIQVKENRHIHRLPRIQPLLLKAETLNLAEIRRDLCRRNAVRRHPDNVLITIIRSRVKRQRRLPGEHAHLALLGCEFPGQHVRDGRVEGHADALGVGDGLESAGEVLFVVAAEAAAVGADGLAAPACGLADLYCFYQSLASCNRVYKIGLESR